MKATGKITKLLAVGLALSGMAVFAEITPEPLDGSVAAFYSLTGCSSGTSWHTSAAPDGIGVVNTPLTDAVTGGYQVQVLGGPRSSVTVTNDTPGKYLFASMNSTVPMATSYMSLQCRATGVAAGDSYGSCIQLPGFSSVIVNAANGTGGCTVEFFVKPSSDSTGFCCYFDMGSGASVGPFRLQLYIPVSGADAKTVKLFRTDLPDSALSTVTVPSDARDSQWHHVAIVYEQPDSTKDGTVRLYYDYKAAANAFAIKRTNTSAELRLGSLGGKWDNWQGLFSAIRVSKKALKQNEMMRASNELRFTPEPLDGSVAAFYPLTGCPSGTSWNTSAAPSEIGAVNTPLTDAVTGGYQVQVLGGPRSSVTVTNDTPGKYLFASMNSTVPMATSYMSLRCRATGVAAGDSWGSCIQLPGFSSVIANAANGTGGCTVEFFVKPSTDSTGFCCYFDMGTGASVSPFRLQLHVPASGADAKTVKLFRTDLPNSALSTVTVPADARDSQWHHVAIVYEQPDSTKDGTVRLYYDYKAAANSFAIKRTNTSAELRLGSLGDKWANWQGLFSAIRVSKKALTREEMMRASDRIDGSDAAIGFYPLDDQPVGTQFTAANKTSVSGVVALWDGFYRNKARTKGYQSTESTALLGVILNAAGDTPAVNMFATNDVPGRYVYSGVTATSPLHELQSSICQLKSSTVGNSSAFMQMQGGSGDLAKTSACTVEFFAKFLNDPALFGYIDLGPGGQNRLLLYPQANGFYVQQGSQKTTAVYPDLTSLVDGKWHHLAMVDDGTGTNFRLYCDYTLVGTAMSVQKNPAGSGELRIGLGGNTALYSCVRTSEKALTPQEFLYASDSADGVLANADWNWRLEGGRDTAVTSATSVGEALDADQYLFKDAHGFTGGATSGGSLLYDLSLLGNVRLIGGVRDGRNRTSATAAGAYLASGLTGPLCAPGLAFTAEVLVQATAPAEGAATVFGAENLSGDPVWNLALDDSGALVLNYALLGGPVVTRKVMDGFAGVAHHVALVADIENRLFKVYVDYAEKLADDSAPGLLAKDGLRFVAAGGCGQSVLTGSVDEIRLTHGLLAPSAFEAFERSGILIEIR